MSDTGAAMDIMDESQPDTMNEEVIEEVDEEEKARNDADTCRICRSEGTEEDPLFYPCKCSGSIKFVHQDCLMEWLSHTNKKHCELCKTPFRFTKLYDSQMPDKLPWSIFLRKAFLHTIQQIILWTRGLLVGTVWLLLLPWSIRWAWTGLFFMMDAGWAREPWIAGLETEALRQASGQVIGNTSSLSNSTSVASSFYDEPLTFKWTKALWHLLADPWRYSNPPPGASYTYTGNVSNIPAQSTLLSELNVARLTSSPSINGVIVDILEGQIITLVVVIAFILVFLIREWVVQQQPILNAAAHVREAEQQIEHFDQARRRIRGDIRDTEQIIDELDQTAQGLRDQLDGAVDRNEADGDGANEESCVQRAQVEPASSRSSERPPRMDWGSLEQRILDVSAAVQIVNDEDANVDLQRIRELAKEALDLMTNARESGVTSEEALQDFKVLIEDVPAPIQSVWQSQLLVQLRQRQSEQRLETLRADQEKTEDAPGDIRQPPDVDVDSVPEPSDTSRRPTMPPRDAANHATRILRALEEEATIHGSASTASADHDSTSVNSKGSGSSWQEVDSASALPNEASTNEIGQRDWPETNGLNIDSTEALQGGASTGSNHEVASAENGAQGEEDNSFEVEESQAETVDEGSHGTNATSNNVFESAVDAAIHDIDEPPQEKNMVQRLFDWFWADIEAPAPLDDVVRVEEDVEGLEEIAQDDGRHVHFDDDVVQHDEVPAQDPEVVAAAAEAGIDPEAVEDGEDMEGVLELIGMQGPILGLLQTAMFCAVLVTITIWGAVGAPFLFGKLALLFIGDPILFLVVLPMQIVSSLGDIVLDGATLALGGVFYWSIRAVSKFLGLLLVLLGSKAELSYLDILRGGAQNACEDALNRFASMFTVEPTNDFVESGYLLVSIHAHKALHDLQNETYAIFKMLVSLVFSTIHQLHHLSFGSLAQSIKSVAPALNSLTLGAMKWLTESWHVVLDNRALTMTIRGPRQFTLEPSLAYWNGTDRTLTVIIGYSFIAMMGMVYLIRTEPLFTNTTLRGIEKSLADVLKQAGGVLKVILIISIEMLLFPLYCGILLDCALLPLFKGATMESRMLFASRSPYFWVFSRWFLGTCYMFHFALFVSMCRRLLRSGVLYFIRDPDDPTFHPVRDVLERNVTTQLKKIAFSALVYGALVILCLGGVIWSVAHVFEGIFPIRWASPEPVYEFPLDFLFYNFITPLLFRYIQPGYGFDEIYEWWLRKSARFLRLSHFLFGERDEDEEGRRTGKSWLDLLWSSTSGNKSPEIAKDDSDVLASNHEPDVGFHKSGRYVRAPASDQVRIARGEAVFVSVTEDEVREGEADQDCQLHGKPNQHFRNVYIPPWFRLRIGFFLGSLWLLSAVIGGGMTILPLAVGRKICSLALPSHVRVNDIYAFSAGIYVLGCAVAVAMNGRGAWQSVRSTFARANIDPVIQNVKSYAVRTLKSFYLYGFAFVIVPAAFALLLQLYLVIPLHTYLASIGSLSAQAETSPNVTLSNSIGNLLPSNTTQTSTSTDFNASSGLASHTVHLVQDGTLGFIYGRVLVRLIVRSRTSWPAAAFRQITRNGYFNPDVKLATRAFVVPTTLLLVTALAAPPMIAGLLNNVVLRMILTDTVTQPMRTKFYRYSYPLCASQMIAAWSAWEAVKATRRWRNRIKDEVYLIGERLHNFGEKKPPEGSKTVARKER